MESSLTRLAPQRLFHGVLGILLLVFAAWVLLDFPVARPWLIVLAVALMVAQWFDPRAWLVALPPILINLDLGLWSGRLLFTEQDALLAGVLGVALVAGQYAGAGQQLVRRSFLPLWPVFLVTLIGLWRGGYPLPELDANALSGYLTGWNAVRVANGLLWGFLFWPLLAVQLGDDRLATEGRLALGATLALAVLGLFLLWEREFFLDLTEATNRWGLIARWLNFADKYRVTGPISQMHLGGEALDGVLMLTVPFALLILFRTSRRSLGLVALLALALAAYGILMTFTRTTYLAAGLSFLSFVLVGLAGAKHLGWRPLGLTLGYVLTGLPLFHMGFRYGGSMVILAYLPVSLGGLVLGWLRPGLLPPLWSGAGFVVLLSTAAALAIHGMMSSKWMEVAVPTALGLALLSVLTLGLGGLAVGRLWRGRVGPHAWAISLLIFSGLMPVVTLGLSGTQIQERVGRVVEDLGIRRVHWQHGLALLDDDWQTRLLGAGLGTFPLTNLLATRQLDEGIWLMDRSPQVVFLRLVGTGELFIGQRLRGLGPGPHRFQALVRNPTQANALLEVLVQPRRLLELERWQPRARGARLPLAANTDWRLVEATILLDGGAETPWADPRFQTFMFANEGSNESAIEIANIRLLDPAGRSLLANGNFAAGGDHWFALNDFRHLAWHLKSLYVALRFDLGWLGLAAFLAFAGMALWRSFVQARNGNLFGAALFASMLGFLALGLTGTLLDVPALMTLFMLLGSAALWRPRVRKRLVKRVPRRSGPGRGASEPGDGAASPAPSASGRDGPTGAPRPRAGPRSVAVAYRNRRSTAWVSAWAIRGPRVVTRRAEAAEARSPARWWLQPWVSP